MDKPATVLDSLNAGLRHALAADESVLLLGEDILDPYGGAFKVTRGLSIAFPDRVLTAPISEAGLVGASAGMALRGLRPVVEIMFGDFITLAADAIVNTLSKYRWMYNDTVRLPLVIRTPMGGRRGYGPTHSQTLEKLFLGVPGLRVLAPFNLDSRAAGAPGDLLSWAVLEQDEPVLFIENKTQYLAPLLNETGLAELDHWQTDAPAPTYGFRLKGAPPPAITLAAYGGMADLARQAMLKLAYEDEILTELIVFTQLAPFEIAPLIESAQKTRRLLTIEEGTLSLGWGAEIVARAAESLGSRLITARRLAAPDQPVPASRVQEEAMLPGLGDMIQLIKNMV